MKFCPKCQTNVQPVHDLHPSGMVVEQCPCGQAFLEASAPPAAAHPGQIEAPASIPVRSAARVVVQEDEDVDVLALAKRKLAAIDAQIGALRRLEAEATMLRRMIEAAERAILATPEHRAT